MKNIHAEELKNKIDSGDNLLIIDVRNPQELMRGKLEKSINIPLDNFNNEIEKKISDKNAMVHLYCLSGGRSIIAAQIMDSLGYKNVYNLVSGMLAWRSKHYPEVNG